MTAKGDWRQATKRQAQAMLLSVDGVGRKTWRKWQYKLRELEIDISQAWREIERQPAVFGVTERQSQMMSFFKKKWDTPAHYMEYLAEKKIAVILASDPEEGFYPPLLREIVDGPEILFVRGCQANLKSQMPVAMVGTRRMTFYGKQCAERLAAELAELKATVVSGFMYGIDVTAQKAAVRNQGKTVSVLGFGLDHCFPRSQKRLMDEMIAQGQTFVSEYTPWTLPRPGTFPERNRIVAGMSWGTVVVEAAVKSGSLITAQLALDAGREVMAVPGPITSIYSEGTKNLLSSGAALVSSGREIVALLRGDLGGDVHERNLGTTDQSGTTGEKISSRMSEKELIIHVLKKAPLGLSFEQLQQETNLSPALIQSQTLLLDLDEQIKIEGDSIFIS